MAAFRTRTRTQRSGTRTRWLLSGVSGPSVSPTVPLGRFGSFRACWLGNIPSDWEAKHQDERLVCWEMRRGETNKYIDLVVLDYSFSYRWIPERFPAIQATIGRLGKPAICLSRFGCGDIPSGHGHLPSR